MTRYGCAELRAPFSRSPTVPLQRKQWRAALHITFDLQHSFYSLFCRPGRALESHQPSTPKRRLVSATRHSSIHIFLVELTDVSSWFCMRFIRYFPSLVEYSTKPLTSPGLHWRALFYPQLDCESDILFCIYRMNLRRHLHVSLNVGATNTFVLEDNFRLFSDSTILGFSWC